MMDTGTAIFTLVMGGAFVAFARPYGRAMRSEGPLTDAERARDVGINTWIARAFGIGLVGIALWSLLGL